MPSNVPWRRAVRMSSTDGSWPSRTFSNRLSSKVVEDVEQLDAVFGGLRPVLIRDLNHFDALTVFVVVDRGGHRADVDDAQIAALGADRQLDDGRDAVPGGRRSCRRSEEVRPGAVHLVDEADARHVVLVGLAPDRLGLGLDAATASKTATAPSRTRRERSTSTVKSTWPGVSMMLSGARSSRRSWRPR